MLFAIFFSLFAAMLIRGVDGNHLLGTTYLLANSFAAMLIRGVDGNIIRAREFRFHLRVRRDADPRRGLKPYRQSHRLGYCAVRRDADPRRGLKPNKISGHLLRRSVRRDADPRRGLKLFGNYAIRQIPRVRRDADPRRGLKPVLFRTKGGPAGSSPRCGSAAWIETSLSGALLERGTVRRDADPRRGLKLEIAPAPPTKDPFAAMLIRGVDGNRSVTVKASIFGWFAAMLIRGVDGNTGNVDYLTPTGCSPRCGSAAWIETDFRRTARPESHVRRDADPRRGLKHGTGHRFPQSGMVRRDADPRRGLKPFGSQLVASCRRVRRDADPRRGLKRTLTYDIIPQKMFAAMLIRGVDGNFISFLNSLSLIPFAAMLIRGVDGNLVKDRVRAYLLEFAAMLIRGVNGN